MSDSCWNATSNSSISRSKLNFCSCHTLKKVVMLTSCISSLKLNFKKNYDNKLKKIERKNCYFENLENVSIIFINKRWFVKRVMLHTVCWKVVKISWNSKVKKMNNNSCPTVFFNLVFWFCSICATHCVETISTGQS